MSQAHPYLVCTKPAYLQLQDAVAPPLSEDFLARMVWEECSLVEGCTSVPEALFPGLLN